MAEAREATIVGAKHCYHGGNVTACDLRGGAALVLAGLATTKGHTTMVDKVQYIDRGYLVMEEKLTQIGAKIYRIST